LFLLIFAKGKNGSLKGGREPFLIRGKGCFGWGWEWRISFVLRK